MTGVGEVLKERKPGVQVVAVEPADSPVLQRRQARPAQDPGHRRRLRARGARHQVYDEVVQVTNDEAFAHARELAREGILVGISAGANAAAAEKVAGRPENKGKLVVTVLCGHRQSATCRRRCSASLRPKA